MSPSSHAAFSRVAVAGDGRDMQVLKSQIAAAARCDLPVLIIGESATGREALARAIHCQSARRIGPFISINCDALSETLLELELFGYRRGAFAGANRSKRGLFEIAHRGTLFLNQVGELSAVSQARLLRVLEQETFQPCGSLVQKEFNARLISVTDHNLVHKIRARRFREALFYRLAVLMIRMPPPHKRPNISFHAMPFIADSFRENDSLDHYLV
jgi:transcriptional regulator with PAS, ATPase and Fis domain